MSRARVAYAELRALSAPMLQPVGNARRSWPQRAGLLLRLGDDQGLVGLGEASPLPGYSADDLATCRERLQQVPWGELELELAADQTFLAPAERVLARLPPAARCAAETALLDLIARRRGLPLATLLRGETPPAAVALSALLVGETPAELLASANAALGRGFRVLKLKVGRPGGAAGELAALRELRRQLGTAVGLRLDANRAWSLAEASAYLAALEEFAPEIIEEPLADARELCQLQTPLRIALDESLQELAQDAELCPLLAAGAVQALVLKPMALGGPLRCLALAQLGASYGVPAVVTHLFDGTVALAGAAAVALALPMALACGLDVHPGLALGPAGPRAGGVSAQLAPPQFPGLGIELEEAQLPQPCLWSSGTSAGARY